MLKGGGEKTMKRKFRRNLKGVSTVIATIIIVAISIVMAIAVAYWVLGIGGSFTRFEKLEFTSAYATYVPKSPGLDNANYTIYMKIKNTGSASATIDPDSIFYNGKPADAYGKYSPAPSFGMFTLEPGNSTIPQLIITLPGNSTSNWVSSMNVELMIQTTAGRQYPKVITLP